MTMKLNQPLPLLRYACCLLIMYIATVTAFGSGFGGSGAEKVVEDVLVIEDAPPAPPVNDVKSPWGMMTDDTDDSFLKILMSFFIPFVRFFKALGRLLLRCLLKLLHVLSRPSTWMAIISLSLLIREVYRVLPPWARLGIRMKLGIAKKKKRKSDSTVMKKEQRDARMRDRGVRGEAGLASNMDITKTETLFVLLKEMRLAFQELWEEVTSDGVKPGFWDGVAFLRLLVLLKPERARDRDDRYLETSNGTFAEDPAAVIKEKGIDAALDFAAWAYYISDEAQLKEKLEGKGFNMLRRDYNTAAGSAAYYLATSKNKDDKVVYVAIKGSDSTADFLANFCLRSTPYNLPGPFVQGGTAVMWAHEGHSGIAKKLVDSIENLISDFIIPAGYQVIFVGHSLGGSLACACGMILRARLAARRYPQILTDNGSMIKVIALAPAPFVNDDVAMQCKPFITSVVNNSDAIPRCSINNLMMGIYFMKLVKMRLDELIGPKNRFGLQYIKILWSNTPFMTIGEFKTGMDVAYEGMEKKNSVDNACVPGQVMILVDLWSKPNYDLKEVMEGSEGFRSAEKLLMCDGLARVLRYLEVCPRMGFDHACESYYSSLKALLGEEPSSTDEIAEEASEEEEEEAIGIEALDELLMDDDDDLLEKDDVVAPLKPLRGSEKGSGGRDSIFHMHFPELDMSVLDDDAPITEEEHLMVKRVNLSLGELKMDSIPLPQDAIADMSFPELTSHLREIEEDAPITEEELEMVKRVSVTPGSNVAFNISMSFLSEASMSDLGLNTENKDDE